MESKDVKRLQWISAFLVFGCVFCSGQIAPPRGYSAHINEFEKLSGEKQVLTFFQDVTRGKKSERDALVEQRILISSADATIDSALAQKVTDAFSEQGRLALIVICARARFIPRSDFPIQQVNGQFYFEGSRDGSESPFEPSFDKVGKDAYQAVTKALHSSDPKLRSVAMLYSGEMEKEFEALSPDELTKRWRAEIQRLPIPIYYNVDISDAGESTRILKRVLASKGLEAAAAITSMLETEPKAWAREREIELLVFIDVATVRLRASKAGQEAIRIIQKTVSTKKLEPAYKSEEARKDLTRDLNSQFMDDKYAFWCGLDSWTNLVALSFDHYFGEHTTSPLNGGTNKACKNDEMSRFISYLTQKDPTFPSWEYPSTNSTFDMFHPKFREKVARYHEAWVEMNKKMRGEPDHPAHPGTLDAGGILQVTHGQVIVGGYGGLSAGRAGGAGGYLALSATGCHE